MNRVVPDLTYLKHVTGNSPEMMRVFIASYLECAPDCMKKLEESCATKNWPALKKAAHDFKPQVNYMGLTEIITLIQEVEDNAAHEVNLDTLAESVKRVNLVGSNALVELKATLASLETTIAE